MKKYEKPAVEVIPLLNGDIVCVSLIENETDVDVDEDVNQLSF